MSRFGKLALFVPLLVLLFGFVIFGLVAEFAYLAMLWATIGGLIVTDWWKWTGVVLLTLPFWLAYRLASNRRRKRSLPPSAAATEPRHN
jgi:uncharacterized BrkB/YihY/UPF0761 family membrane protein